jgi:Zn-dependent M16 (insulinase) family peptidase
VHQDKCRGIVYTDVYFEPSAKNVREIVLLSLLTNIFGVYGTENYTEEQLANAVRANIGDMEFSVNVYPNVADTGLYVPKFVFSIKALADNMPKAYEISREVLMRTKIDDPARLLKTVNEELSKFDSKLIVTAQRTVFSRLSAMATEGGRYADIVGGIDYYRTLIELRDQLKNGEYGVMEELKAAMKRAVNMHGADLLVICDKDKQEDAVRAAKSFMAGLPSEVNKQTAQGIAVLPAAKEGIVIASMVSYVGCGFNYKLCGYDTNPCLPVVKKYLTSGYLWNNIRVIGGAYGAMMMAANSGSLYFVSYRDPKIKETLNVYKGIAGDIRALSLSQTEVDRLIIGTMSEIDMPMPVYAKGRRIMRCEYNGVTYEDLAAGREAVLATTLADIKNTADLISDTIGSGAVCVAAGESMLKECTGVFDQIIKP